MRHFIVMAGAIALASCSASWTKPGASPSEADAASVACTAEAYQGGAKSAAPMPAMHENYLLTPDRQVDPGIEQRNAAFTACMLGKGFTRAGLESVAKAAPPPAPARAKEAPGQRAGDECDSLIGANKYVKGRLSADYLTCFDTRYEEYSKH